MASLKLLLLLVASLSIDVIFGASDTIIHDEEFSFPDLHLMLLDGTSEIMPDASLTLNNASGVTEGDQVFYARPLKFTRSSFSTSFLLTIEPEFASTQPEGVSFIISPAKSRASTSSITIDLKIGHNSSGFGQDSHFLVEIKVNGKQIHAKHSPYLRKAGLRRGQQFVQVWLDYDAYRKEITGSVISGGGIGSYAPTRTSFSYPLSIGPYVRDHMFVGIAKSSSTRSDYYVSGWSLKMNGKAPEIDIEMMHKFTNRTGVSQNFQSRSSGIECRPCSSCVEKFLRRKSNCSDEQIQVLVHQLCHQPMDMLAQQAWGR